MDREQAFDYVATHVFCPTRLPVEDDRFIPGEQALVAAVIAAARDFAHVVDDTVKSEWLSIVEMLRNLECSVQSARLDERNVAAQFAGMQPGDVRAFFILAQNAAVVFTKQKVTTLYVAFEVSPQAKAVITTQGKLNCSYPGPAIEIPNTVFDDKVFQFELANFLARMNEDMLVDSAADSMAERPTCRHTTDPRYITELLTGILRGVGRPAVNVVRITKRIGDDVVAANSSSLPWRRSSLWLIIRVVLQTILQPSSPHGRDHYKTFIISFLIRLARKAIQTDATNDLLHCISAKIIWRLRKLAAFAPEWLSKDALDACSRIRTLLDDRWERVQAAQRASPPYAFLDLDLASDARLSLRSSRKFLGNRLLDHDHVTAAPFHPDHPPRGTLDVFLTTDHFLAASQAHPHLTLYDVEKAIEEGIDNWVDSARDVDQACVQLEMLAQRYSSCALETYAKNPEQLSIMILTMLELWVALDKLATKSIFELADFSPEVPVALLEKLLLRKASNLGRLRLLHQYLCRRHSHSHAGSSVFSQKDSEKTLAVRYYNRTPSLRALKAQIKQDAEQEVKKKVAELHKANDEYERLSLEATKIQHTQVTLPDGTNVHPVSCDKCILEARLGDMTIEAYEWPLPEDELRAAIVVFELRCPVAFDMWRAITFRFLFDICSQCPSQKRPCLLSAYPGLRNYLVRHPRSRITLAVILSKRRELYIPATEAGVSVENGICFYLFDQKGKIPVSQALGHYTIERYCTHKVQQGPYHNLQRYVDTTSHTSNEVLASQSDCHKDLSIHEFIAFGHMRSGGVLQWLNILRGLRDHSLSFRSTDVHLLLAQASTQVGSLSSTGEPLWHAELHEASFGHALTYELDPLIYEVDGNWLESVTMHTISFFLSRLLAVTRDEGVSERALMLLRHLRENVYGMVQKLLDRLAQTPGDEELRGLLRDAAAICRSTFDVGSDWVQQVLRPVEDVKVFISCAIILHDNTPNVVSTLSMFSRLLLGRDRRLSMDVESVLAHVIQTDASDEGINLAIRSVWPGYRPGEKWTQLPSPNARWFSCKTASTSSQSSQVMHFNLLSGSLLVDGKPLSRLPSSIIQHPLYNHIFGQQVLDVIPGDLPGMDYSTRGTISGHQVSFALRNKDLVIRAKRVSATGSSNIIELIPQNKLGGDLPAVLLKAHVHWLDLSTSVMEIRPFDKLWEFSPENWRIDCTPGQYRMYKGCKLLIDIRSPSWTMMSELLKPLDSPQNILVTVSSNDPDQPPSPQRLSVTLPRYGLSFYVDEDGDLQSHNIRGMVYDKDQSAGTLYGLVNRLVLWPKPKEKVNMCGLVPRCVLIPEGKVSFKMDDDHVCVEIDTRGSTLERVTYQTYQIDTDLGCLTGTVSLTSKLYRAYLHALTSSGCNPDPLTGRSGTEEALGILRSAGCSSTMKLSSRDAKLLRSIAWLCPARSLHPSFKDTQIVYWLDIPVLSQNEQLYCAAKAIKDHFERMQFFHEGWETEPLKTFPSYNSDLLARSLHRTAYLLPSETSERLPRGHADVDYTARDILGDDSAEHRAYLAAVAVFEWSLDTTSIAVTDIVDLADTWKCTMSSETPWTQRYHKAWLEVDLSTVWLKAYNLLRDSQKSRDRFQLLFSLPAMAYGSPDLCDIVPTLLAFALHPSFRTERPPADSDYNLLDGYQPTWETVSRYVLASAKSFDDSSEFTTPARPIDRTWRAQEKYRRKLYDNRLDKDTSIMASRVTAAWRSRNPPTFSPNTNYDIEKLNAGIREQFKSCGRNTLFREHLIHVQTILRALADRAQTPRAPIPSYTFDPAQSLHTMSQTSWLVTLDQLISTRPAPFLPARGHFNPFTIAAEQTWSVSGARELNQMLSTIQGNLTATFQYQYASNLKSSTTHFCNEVSRTSSQMPMEQITDEHIELLADYYATCEARYLGGLDRLKGALGPDTTVDKAFEQSGQWPRITAEALFRCLASTSPIKLERTWARSLVRLAIFMLELQRARRLLRLVLDGLQEDFHREFENDSFDGWDPEAHPDWILIQLQGNFLVRRVQVQVANEMISPSSGTNTALQLNMGEGKSSVIVPISVTKLADGKQLARIIIPKALTAQMFQLLVDRLGGLTNRRVYYLPFTRSLPLDSDRVACLRELMLRCMHERAVVVIQPDHVLSLKLLSVEKQLANDASVAEPLVELQKWLHSHARDVLDESDEILHVRYQLVYTIGLQQQMEGSPERWTTTQQILFLAKKHALSLQSDSKEGVECEHGPPGAFPHIRISQPDAGIELISRIARDVVDGSLPNFNFQQLNGRIREAIFAFIVHRDVSPLTCKIVEDYARQTTLWSGLLLLRGILAMGVLLFGLRDQRWRVDYGLASHRTMLAVPYRAKDVPAPRAEFGHPDVAILLTCLSYYYEGLTEEQLKISFEILLQQDDPSLDYEHWIQGRSSVPRALRSYTGINLKSSEQWTTLLIPFFSHNHATVDFFLARVVFPKEAKEFPSKLACSGWDLAEKKERLLTGFSGTNDARYLLPLHITQRDPDHQRGTNAKVLSYLLQPENKCYLCMTQENGKRPTTVEFLELLVAQTPEIRVLLDVGAQMLDLQNRKLAEEWLAVSRAPSAAIYFNEDDELTVLTRDGSTQLLMSSPFAQQLDQCVIYLDDAHTRGTDIKFPSGFRAAVTLGPKVTKDRLVQGCMRMRKLGTSHSVMFFAPLEVERKIRALCTKDSTDETHTVDIIRWVIQETFDEIQQRAFQWAHHGMDHQVRYDAWSKFCASQLTPRELSSQWLQPEAKSLEELYAPEKSTRTIVFTVPEIRDRCATLGVISLHAGGMEEEQEREVIHEVEQERQVERPPRRSPAEHALSGQVTRFIKTGILPNPSNIFRPVFTTLGNTSAVAHELLIWSRRILATEDFCNTLAPSQDGVLSKMDDFLRPVQWIVSSKTGVEHVLVILSPFEVERLLPSIRKSPHVHLHLYTPRTTKAMEPSDDLRLYSIPGVPLDWAPPHALMNQLNVFAGQLFLIGHAEYIQLCRFFCVYSPDLQNEEEMVIGYDGFIKPEHRRGALEGQNGRTFQNTPLPFVKVLLGLRRKGMSFAETHMGKLLEGRLLADSDF